MSHYQNQIDEQMEEAQEATPTTSTDAILNERGARYGSFDNHARLTQTLNQTILQHYFKTHGGTEAKPLPPYMAEAIHMICHKLARIANGDPFYDDSWRDISGFSQLVVEQLTTKTRTGV